MDLCQALAGSHRRDRGRPGPAHFHLSRRERQGGGSGKRIESGPRPAIDGNEKLNTNAAKSASLQHFLQHGSAESTWNSIRNEGPDRNDFRYTGNVFFRYSRYFDWVAVCSSGSRGAGTTDNAAGASSGAGGSTASSGSAPAAISRCSGCQARGAAANCGRSGNELVGCVWDGTGVSKRQKHSQRTR